MATQLQLRRGTTAENNVFTGAVGEVTVDTDTNALRVHDGSTTGGFMVDTVVAFQAPTAQNNYTWYRKYASGWVEQGGTASDRQGSVVLPVTMSDANYMISQTLRLSGSVPGSAQICPYVKNVSSTGFDFYNNPTGTVVWQVSGMAA